MGGTPQESQHEGRVAATRQSSVPSAVPWGVLDGLAMLPLCLLLQVAFSFVVGDEASELSGQLKVAAASNAAALVVIWLLVRLWSGQAEVRRLLGLKAPCRGAFLSACGAIVAGGGAYLAVHQALSAALGCLGMSWEDVPRQTLVRMISETRSVHLVWLSSAMGILLAPMAEEVIFRSVLYLPLRERWGVVPAAVAMSVVFAAMHAYPWGAPMLFVLGLTFVALFECTGTLWAPMVAHGLYNGVMIFLARLPGAAGW